MYKVQRNIIIFLLGVGGYAATSIAFAAHVTGVNGNGNIGTGPTDHYAWNDVIGWIDFGHDDTRGGVQVTDTDLKGFAYNYNSGGSGIGEIVLNCATPPAGFTGDYCTTLGNWKVTNTTSGVLAGWAWNDVIGWISFCGNESGGAAWNVGTWVCPTAGTALYGVRIITAPGQTQGDFTGWAWNDIVGWISFNCANDIELGTLGTQSTCAAPYPNPQPYKVWTTWAPPPTGAGGYLISSVFPACITPEPSCATGATLNWVKWTGVAPNGTVSFQIAASKCPNGAINPAASCTSGVWNDDPACDLAIDSCFVGPLGTSGTSNVFSGVANQPIHVSLPFLPSASPGNNNFGSYFRYKVFLNAQVGPGPQVNDVIMNWSP